MPARLEQKGEVRMTLQGNSGAEEADRHIDRLIAAYGEENFRSKLHDFLDRLTEIGLLNKRLSELSGKEAEYGEVVQRIVAATQDYYNFLGQQPEDLRSFYMLISGSEEGDMESLKSLKILGVTMPKGPSPLLKAQSIRPKSYIMQIDAITNQLALLEDSSQLRVGTRSNQPVLTTVTLDMPDSMRIAGGGQLTTYDKSIINGVTSLLESGNAVFSIPMLYHAMTGRQNPSLDDGLYKEIESKLDQMRRMLLTIDLTEEAKAHYVTGEGGEQLQMESLEIEGYLLPLNKVTGVVNGKKTQLYQIIQHPPLYSYSKLRRQLASVEIGLLGAPVNNNSTTIPLKTYLLQRIELMKNRRNRISQNNILYESIYQELGVMEAGKTKKMRIRGYTTTILAYFVEKGYIANYVEYRKGRTIAGVTVHLD